jgi:hypothetical protein
VRIPGALAEPAGALAELDEVFPGRPAVLAGCPDALARLPGALAGRPDVLAGLPDALAGPDEGFAEAPAEGFARLTDVSAGVSGIASAGSSPYASVASSPSSRARSSGVKAGFSSRSAFSRGAHSDALRTWRRTSRSKTRAPVAIAYDSEIGRPSESIWLVSFSSARICAGVAASRTCSCRRVSVSASPGESQP